MLNISNSICYNSLANTYNIAKKKKLSKGIKYLKAILNLICLYKQKSSFKKSYFNNII
jgi:predicted AAA+ superfamily ATPase